MYESSRLFAEASKHAARDFLRLRAWHRLGIFCACSLLLTLSACSSPQLLASEEGAGDENEIVATDGAEPTVTFNDGGQCVLSSGPGVIRRLTKREYQKSLVSLFESTDFPYEEPLSGNIEEGGYSTRASGLWVRDLSAQAISIHAEAIAEWAVESVPERISLCRELTPSCVDEMLETFARRAFRMSLTDVMRERYSATLLGRSDWSDAARLLVSVAIQSPYFLYRRELGVAQGSEALLSADERAASLAYSLTANSPDAELQAAAASDTLNSQAQLQAEASRLLDTEGTVDALSAFVIEWLALEPVLTKTKTEGDIELSPELREAMLGEVRALVAAVYREGGGLSELLRRETVFVNGVLAAHYEIEGVSGDEFVEVPAGNRVGGLLGTAAYLISHSTVDSSSPTARGYFIRKRLLCLDVPPPPPSVDTDLPMLTGDLTTRQRFSQHLADPVCESCHVQIDNYGYAFESYDGLGRFRERENGIAVETVGQAVDLDGASPAFNDGRGLTALLVGSAQVEACFHQHLLEYISGQVSWDSNCSVDEVVRSSDDASLQSTLSAIVSLPHYQSRIPQGEL